MKPANALLNTDSMWGKITEEKVVVGGGLILVALLIIGYLSYFAWTLVIGSSPTHPVDSSTLKEAARILVAHPELRSQYKDKVESGTLTNGQYLMLKTRFEDKRSDVALPSGYLIPLEITKQGFLIRQNLWWNGQVVIPQNSHALVSAIHLSSSDTIDTVTMLVEKPGSVMTDYELTTRFVGANGIYPRSLDDILAQNSVWKVYLLGGKKNF